ncbi:type VII secretion protein EccC [Citricoccus zhacaiensis]|uniref:Type VII secretion protein EccC n=1 Tax=Citricoccus zhacaiensis TaxID=489142 RepID=A0ABQ2M1K0_9MICC|nr:type VII secretion protein EccCa [Citricoccus zhacaiensis]GGO45778.1 type VII secretion protein EccC [Citricoccus zhacaiensis]
MTQKIIHRPARTSAPARLYRPFRIEGPQPLDPAAAEGESNAGFLRIMPMFAAGASMMVMMTFRQSPFAAVGAIAMMLSLIVAVVMMFSQRGKAGRLRKTVRDTYARYLERTRVKLRDDEQRAQLAARASSPPPAALFDIVRDPARVWERRRYHEDFLRMRLGSGRRPTREIDISVTETSTALQDEFMLREAEALKSRFEVAPDMPVTVPLDSAGNISLVGPRDLTLQVVRSLMAGAAALQSPEDVRIALITPRATRADWDWLELLPHLDDNAAKHFTGPVKLIVPDPEALVELLNEDLQYRSKVAGEHTKFGEETLKGPALLSRLIVIVDRYGHTSEDLAFGDSHFSLQSRGITAIHLCENRLHEPSEVSYRVTLHDGLDSRRNDGRPGFLLEDRTRDQGNPVRTEGVLDPLDTSTASGLVRELAPLRLALDSLEHTGAEAASSSSFLQMLHLSPALDRADVERNWRPRSQADFLRVPLGPDDKGKPVLLDLKEAAQLGMGPHGLCVGATGSGKSEMLRSLVFGLLTTHSPDSLAMVLVDFKGGATFAPFEGAPHVTGIITNLSDDLTLIERVYASLNGEILRRQEVLKAAGNIANITDYQIHRDEERSKGRDIEPLPHLVVIIDEFGELLTARPDFIDLFLSIGRIGRSIGVHLLLSSQRVESGKLRGLETYLSYRIGLRTLSESESRTVLDTPDAFHLPPLPGYGYLKVDTTVYSRFKSGYVSGPLEDEVVEEHEVTPQDEIPEVLTAPEYSLLLEEQSPASGQDQDQAPAPKKDGPARRTTGPTVMSTMMDTLRTYPPSVKPIWLPPLPLETTLDRVVGEPKNTEGGLRLPAGGNLTVPVGLLDDPARQWQGLWEIDFTSGSGNMIVHGGPQSGKSTALRTIVASLALTHSPQQVGIYCIDLLGSGLLPLQDLPHVGGVAIRTNTEVISRTVDEILGMLSHRERVFEKHAIDSLQTMRRMHAEGRLPELPSADIFLVVDGHGQFQEEFDDLLPKIVSIMTRGAGYGIHIISSVNRNNEIRATHQTYFTHRIELALAEPGDSQVDRKLAANVHPEAPGRGLTPLKLQGHLALPRIDGQAEKESATEGLKDLVEQVGRFSTGAAMKVRVLPPVVEASSVPTSDQKGLFPLGLRELDLGVQQLDLERADRNLIVMGDEEAGKTNMLRQVVQRFTANHRDDELMFVVFDPRRGLGDVVPDDYLGGYATNAEVAKNLVGAVVNELRKRQDPKEDQKTVQRQTRIVALIDDYDVLTVGGGQSPLGGFVPFIPMAAELRLNFVLTRRVRGASRGMYETFFSTLRDNGTSALIMSGDRREGNLINGLKARKMPPGRGQLLMTGKPVMTVQTFFGELGDRPE